MKLTVKVKLILSILLLSFAAQALDLKDPDLDSNSVPEPVDIPVPAAPSAQTVETPSANPSPAVGTSNVSHTGSGDRVIQIEHPNAAKGLLRIEKDKAYQYQVPLREKRQASTISVDISQPPNISSRLPNGDQLTFKSMYGSGSTFGMSGNYEWMPFKKFGSLGLVLESGISDSHGTGQLFNGDPAQETYSLFIIPLTAMLKYRFEYVRRQWVVPFIEGGASYYGFLELRDDGKYQIAGSEAVGGGGGLMFSISRLDQRGAFELDREFGIADMWFTLSARQMVGLKSSLDMTNTILMAGVTVDY